jgi:2-oxoisovalerate dehydrogenase E2 component (dihydrolipoyl transacylase)
MLMSVLLPAPFSPISACTSPKRAAKSTPIIVQPQVAILSTEAIIKRPVVIDDMIAIRSMMNLSLSFDHRALDGLAAARFLQQVRTWLEQVTHDQV